MVFVTVLLVPSLTCANEKPGHAHATPTAAHASTAPHHAAHHKGAKSATPPADVPRGHGKHAHAAPVSRSAAGHHASPHRSAHGAHASSAGARSVGSRSAGTGETVARPVAAARKPMARPEADDDEPGVGAFQHGCALPGDGHEAFLAGLGVRDPELAAAFARDFPAAVPAATGCVPYAAARGETGEIRALGIIASDGAGARHLYLYSRLAADGGLRTEVENVASELDFNTYTAPLGDVLSRAPTLYTALPPEVLLPLASIAPLLGPGAASATGTLAVRVGYAAGGAGRPPRLLSVQLINDGSGAVEGEALWIDRPDLPGGFFGPDGRSFEHALWTSPVTFTRISRGVGAYHTTVVRSMRRRVGHHVRIVHKRQTKAGTHVGVDYAAPMGTPVVAVADGRVVEIGRHGGYGNLIVVEHAGGYTTRYAHLSAFAPDLQIGAEVRRGLEIGYVGSTGHSTGPHLHFEIRLDGVYLDPLDDRLAFGLWSMRSTDYVAMLRQTLLAEALAPLVDPIASSAGAPGGAAAPGEARLAAAPMLKLGAVSDR